MTVLFPKVRKISKTAMNILQKRYFWENESTWEEVADRVVDNVLVNSPPKDRETTREMIKNTYFVPNSPCLVNAGRDGAGLCACFVVDFPDTIEGIYKTKLDFALIARKGGGAGTSIEKIRPEGSKVAGSTHGYAGGGVKFADTISHDADALTQAGFRSMAIMFTESIYHPDIIKFITAKEEEGKIANANISVMVDDAFMKKVENDENYWTEFNGVKYQEYSAKDIFNLIVEGAWKNGEPGLLFRDRINNSPYKDTGQEIFSTNPCSEQPLPSNGVCLSQDTLFTTRSGIRKISNIKNDTIVSSSGKNNNIIVNDIYAFNSGRKQLIQINFHNGMNLKCSKEHLIFTDKGYIQAQELLKENAKIKWMESNPIIYSIDKSKSELDFYLMLGWMHGDGWMTENTTGISFNNKDGDFEIKDRLLLEYHKHFGLRSPGKNDTISYQEQTETKKYKNQLVSWGVKLGKAEKREIPETFYSWNIEQQMAFLSAIFTADGFIQGRANNQAFLASRSKILLTQIQTILASLGIQSAIYETVFTTKRKNQYKLKISKESALKFMDYIGFITSKKNNKFNYNGRMKYLDEKYLPIDSIEELGIEDVFDFSSQSIHNGFANGILVHNCNLGSLDLSKFLDSNHKMNWVQLGLATRLSVRFLDSVIDITTYPTEDIHKWAIENRAIGLGIMGFADYCLMKELAYGSEESLNKLEEILNFVYLTALDESENLGEQLGVPLMCQKLPSPRRNITVLTVAPTGTISLIASCSSGIEPIFSEITIRNDKTGSYTFVNDLAAQPYFRCAVSANGAIEVTWEEHIKVLAMAQKYVDSGVSKTINFPSHTHRETMGKAVMMAWKEGCKGLAMYRNGSRKVEVLTPSNVKKDKCPVCGNDLVILDGKKKCVVCKQDTALEKTATYYD